MGRTPGTPAVTAEERVDIWNRWCRLQEQGRATFRQLAKEHTPHRSAQTLHTWVSKGPPPPVPENGRGYALLREGRPVLAPVPLAELGPAARASLDDIELFARRYFGLVVMPYQSDAAAKIVGLQATDEEEYVVINQPPGTGKALALDTPLPTPTGWTTIKDVAPGDWLFDEQGHPCRVTAKSEVFYGHDCFEVRSDDGASVVADAEHLWRVRLDGNQAKATWPSKTGPKTSVDGRYVHTTVDLARHRAKRPQLQVAGALRLPDTELLVDPYVLGVWLGDGNSSGGRITADPADAVHLRKVFEVSGYRTTDQSTPMNFGVPGLKKDLRALGVLDNKHIPAPYLRASAAMRLALLQGLVDTDGYVSPDGLIEFCNTNLRLIRDVHELVLSLGVKASFKEGRATIDGRDCGPKYRVVFMLANAARLPRKLRYTRDGVRTPSRYLTVTPCESVPTQCIQVDSPSQLFLAGSGMMVTHNSTFFTLVLPAWVTCRDRTIRGFIGSASATTAGWYTGRLRTAFTRRVPVRAKPQDLRLGIAFDAESTLVADFGKFKPDQGDEVWQAGAFTVAQFDDVELSEKERTWSAFGRATTFLGSRVDLVIWDDAYDPSQVKTLQAKEEMFSWWDDIAETRLEPGGLLILQGQRLGPDDLYRYALDKRAPAAGEDVDLDADEEPEMSGRKYHHIVYPAHFEDRCQGRETHRRDAPPYPEGCLLFPRRLPWSKLRVIRENTPDKFEVVYQQNDVAADEVLVRPLWVTGGEDAEGIYPGCWDNDRGVWELPRGLAGDRMVVMSVDPSPTMYWAVQAWCLVRDAQSGSELRFLLDLEGVKMTSDDFLDWNAQSGRFTGLAEEWMQRSVDAGLKIGTVIVEVNAAARFMLQSDAVRRWQQRWAVNLIPHTTSRNKSDPDLGVPMIGPRWKYGQVRLPGRRADRFKSVKLIDEVTRWQAGVKRRDDQVMAEWFFEHNIAKLAPVHSEPVRMWVPSWAATA